MARDLYKNRYDLIKGLKATRTNKGLIDLGVKMARQLNQRFYRLEKKGIGLNDTAYRYAKSELGKMKPRYSTSKSVLAKMDQAELVEYLLQMNQKLMSETSTIPGLQKVYDKRISGAVEALNESVKGGIDEESFNAFLEIGGHKLLNNRYLDSTQIIEDFVQYTKDGNVSAKEFVREYKRFKNAETFDYGKFKRNLKRLDNRKRKR